MYKYNVSELNLTLKYPKKKLPKTTTQQLEILDEHWVAVSHHLPITLNLDSGIINHHLAEPYWAVGVEGGALGAIAGVPGGDGPLDGPALHCRVYVGEG